MIILTFVSFLPLLEILILAAVIPCAVVFGVVGVIEVFDALNKPSESDKAKAFNKCMQEYVQGVVDAAITDLYNHEISQLMDSYYIAGHDVVTLANSSSFSMATKRDELVSGNLLSVNR